jgi:hypothetical protein
MIIGIIIILILAAIGVGFLAAVFWKRAGEQREEIEQLQDFQIESPASESIKKQPVNPDFNPHPYSAKFERFGDDEIEEAREYLTTKQRKQIGG